MKRRVERPVSSAFRSTLKVSSSSARKTSNASSHAPEFCVPVNGSPYSIAKRRVPEPIPVLGSQPAGDVGHKPGGRLPLLFARPAATPATLKRAATNFAAW